MTQEKLMKLKRAILAERDRQDREAIEKRRIPLRLQVADWIGFPGPREKWLEKWKEKHEAALRIATRAALNAAISATVAKEARLAILRNGSGATMKKASHKLAKGRA